MRSRLTRPLAVRSSSLLLSLLAFFMFLTAPDVRAAATCNLQMTLECTASGGKTDCVATTKNVGANVCIGDWIVGYFVDGEDSGVTFTDASNGLGLNECFDAGDTATPQEFVLCFGAAQLAAGDSFPSRATVMSSSAAEVPIIAVTWVGGIDSGEELGFAYAFNGVAAPSCTPRTTVAPIANSGTPYDVRWSATSEASTNYEIQESTTADFSVITASATLPGLSNQYRHDVSVPTTYYYRVRATSCGGSAGPYSPTVSVVVQPPPVATSSSRGAEAVAPFGSTAPVAVKLLIQPPAGKTALDTSFNATVDKPYMTVTPSSGTIPPTGITLTVTATPGTLPPGANTGTVSVTSGGSTIATVPVTVSLVTPVSGGGKSPATPSSLVIPIVTHVNTATGQFLSDVRLTNADTSVAKYQVVMTPTRTDASQSSKTTTIDVPGGQTIALNDIAKNFFGFGATGAAADVGFGALEIRPIGASGNLTYASSRTYFGTAAGTFGQFIAAVPLSRFASNAVSAIPGLPPSTLKVMSLQQVAQSAKFRTNLGIVEGSGTPASGRLRFFDGSGTLLKEVPYSLMPGEHQQHNSVFAANQLNNVEDGRIEITVDSPTGAVTAYASVLDQQTTDPLAVMPAFPSEVQETRYVLPGMAGYAAANFRSDVRIYNGGTSDAIVTLTFFPQGQPAATSAPVRVGPGQVRAYDDVVATLFNRQDQGGSIVVTTATATSLVVTGRTYSNAAAGGTYGQFIPGVSPSGGLRLGSAPLQVLQLEQSKNFRTNLGLVELTGNPATVRVKVILPDSLATPLIEVPLAANEFRQLNRVIESIPGGLGNVYNARVVVEVISGSGSVAAYGSVIDNATSDPTYVPAQ